MCWCEPLFGTSQPSRSVKADRPAVAAGLQLLATFDRMAERLLSEAGESVRLLSRWPMPG
jgi:hypothetical protein